MRLLALAAVLLATTAGAQTPTFSPDIPATAFDAVTPDADYVRREAMIPMRDGTKLYTVIVMKKGTRGGPMLLTRTPYNASKAVHRNPSQRITEILPVSDAVFVEDGYIRVYQDVRGINKSEGDYVVNRPLIGPLNPSTNDHSTDTWDTIDWLVKNVPEGNGRVAITGSSYPGFTSLMALYDPHPALKAAVPMSPMVDGWKGDDWFHNGAFRQINLDWMTGQLSKKDGGDPVAMGKDVDAYSAFLQAGSAGDFFRAYGLTRIPFVAKLMEHPAYDSWWQGQALDTILADRPLKVPTMLVVGQWDQEDSYGAPAVYRAWEPKDRGNDKLSLVIGPWRHSGVNYDGSGLGALRFAGDTALQFRRDVMKPFLDQHLRPGSPDAKTPPVLTYATGADQWQRSPRWPMGTGKPLYLQPGGKLAFAKPAGASASDSYISDPAKPVPFLPRPVRWREGEAWRTWLVADQRFADGRPDVLTYVTDPLDTPVHIMGAPQVDLWAATSGTDSDWVVKVIDVYPEENSADTDLGGYELGVGIDIFRGRYVHSLSQPAALTPNKAERYRFALPDVNHVFQRGHRIMVQVQSSLFPLYDRNPQSFVANIFDAKSGDYRAATQQVFHGGDMASAVVLPVAEDVK